jgi:hypothetical protein
MRTDLAPARSISPARAALVAAGLVPLGAAAGALAGALGFIAWVVLEDGWAVFQNPSGLLAAAAFAGFFGAPCGAVLLPIAGFTVLRYVPMGRVLGETILATAVGAALGMWGFGERSGDWFLLWPVAGFAVAAVRLWLRARRQRRLLERS